MKTPAKSSDPDIRGSWPAMKRAARRARRLALETGTPLYVMVKGKVVDLNRGARKGRKKSSPS